MESSNRSALKEWATVEAALAEGPVVLLIRKGGISERRGDFQVEHREFWLFPTHYHQNLHELTEPFQLLDGCYADVYERRPGQRGQFRTIWGPESESDEDKKRRHRKGHRNKRRREIKGDED